MAELDEKIKKTWDDVEKLQIQIGSILNSLKANKELFEVNLVSVLTNDVGEEPNKLITKPSNLLSKLSRQKKLIPLPIDKAQQHNLSTVTPAKQLSTITNQLQFFPPIYNYIESETFLIPLLDRWYWGTTILNTSKSAAAVPVLNLRIVRQNSTCAFSYNYDITFLESEVEPTNSTTSPQSTMLDVPFQEPFLRSCTEEIVKPGCRALLTASFATPMRYCSAEDRVELVATLSLDGRYQWSQYIDLRLSNLFYFKDDLYKRFQTQIFLAMSQCHDTFKLQRLSMNNARNDDMSPSNAIRSLLMSFGFEISKTVSTQSHVSIDYFICDVPTLLYGVLVRVEKSEGDSSAHIRCSVSSRSPNQMQSLVRLISSWVHKERKQDFLISNLSSKGTENMRLYLLEEIEILSHLVILSQKNVLDSFSIVHNWLTAYTKSMVTTDSSLM